MLPVIPFPMVTGITNLWRTSLERLLASGCLEMRDGALYNERAERDGERRLARKEQARKAADARWSAPEAEASPTQPELIPEDEPSPKPKRAKRVDDSPIVVPFDGVLHSPGMPVLGGITEAPLGRMHNKNPSLDVRGFLEMMAGKLKAGNLRAPKASGLERACRNWLQRELQDGRSRFRRGPKSNNNRTEGPRRGAGSLLDMGAAAYDDAVREVGEL